MTRFTLGASCQLPVNFLQTYNSFKMQEVSAAGGRLMHQHDLCVCVGGGGCLCVCACASVCVGASVWVWVRVGVG